IIDEVRVKQEYDTLPRKRFFTCANYEADGFHYRQPWVIGVQEQIESLTKRLEEAEEVMKFVPSLKNQIETLEAQAKGLTRQVDRLTAESSTPLDVDSAEAPVTSPGLVKPVERRKWSTKEDIVLISAWLNTSKDPIFSNEQKLGSFWKRIGEYFNSSPHLLAPFHNIEVNGTSVRSEMEITLSAEGHDIFFDDYNVKFTLEHCWRELRFDQKWRSHSQPKEKSKEGGPQVVADEEEVRPPGVKASKAAKRKKPNEAAFDRIQTILAQKNTISKQKILDRLLAKNIDTLSDHEVALKNKLISEML
uniref:No apical meristem-associated C-terminal domain-containing protein n=1 Tax=Brassica oleracea var. oleracea TaxID=109376 RepID=A0A0D2ZVQ3_BRAOL